MNTDNQPIVVKGGGFLTLLGILFIGLKLTGFITWSWWWVLAPIWIPWATALIISVLMFVGVIVSQSKKL